MTTSQAPAAFQADAPSPFLKLATMMFLQFFVWGAWYVSMTGWMGTVKFDGLIAWAYTVGPIAALISPFFLGMIADRFFPTQRVLGAMHLLGGLIMFAVPMTASSQASADNNFFHPYILLLFAHMLCYMPTLGLTNTLAFHHIRRPEREFPMIRVFGTIGWIVGNIVVGGSLKLGSLDLQWIQGGDKSAAQFYVTGGAAILLGLFSFALPHTPPPLAGKKVTVREILGLDAIKLLAKPSYLVFILCSFLICIPLAGYYNYARNFVEFTGFKNATFTMSYGQMSEIFFMLIMPLLFARLGVKWMILVGMAAWVARYGLFAASTGAHVEWMVIIGIVLHGICYDFFFVTGQIYVDKAAPTNIRGQAQGFLVLVTQGLGLGLGAQAFGRLVGHFTDATTKAVDWKMVWTYPAIAAAAIMVIFFLGFWEKKNNDAKA